MENAIYIGLSRQTALRRELALVANNIANANTTSFKRELSIYGVAPTVAGPDAKLDFVIDHGASISFEPGSFKVTENDFDVAISGPGFFAVDDGTGIKYTRNGAFSRNGEGTLVTSSGYVVQPEIQIPDEATSISVSSNGTVTITVPGQVGAQEVGQLTLADFSNLTGLQPIGENFLVETEASGAPILSNPLEQGFGKLVQGALEGSNVNVVQELVDMIETQRAYEVSSKAITSVDDMLRFISNNL